MDQNLVEIRVLSKSGETKWIETNSTAIQWEGRPAIQAYITGITEQKRLESQLQQAMKMESIGTLAGGLS